MTAIMNTYGRLPVTFTSGKGSWLTDTDGKTYLDALCGIAVCGLGHAHPAISKTLTEQAGRLIHTSNLYGIERQQALADALVRISGMSNVFFSNSGAEANEAAIKIARKYGHQHGIHEPVIIVMSKAFHGRTLATLTATGNAKAQEGFGPLLSGFIRVPYNDLDTLTKVAGVNASNVVAVMLETVQGEGGLATASLEYLQGVRALCDQHKWLMMVDEVQTGNGRTGSYFSYQQLGFVPDVVTTAKGLGNGIPIGACLARGAAAEVLQPGSHGSTYGGNPLCSAVALSVVETIEADNLCANAREMGEYLATGFRQRLQNNPHLIDIRGRGLMMGLVMDRDCPELMARGLEYGILLNVTAGNVIRLLPALNLHKDDADKIIDIVCNLIDSLD
ncbi:aspartate aminotransferase family protein [Candidatus Thalassolituus haligoni]|uniref:aspartate aminotransferase family protein n=1 Tax=Candidatus Thalassolituus haligoni TaxID=3100113 RepID=UPI0035155001|tara:strand:- start:25621 stop:26790 length:1170 start_codon:yes stop_codon:yes gene_type:complete